MKSAVSGPYSRIVDWIRNGVPNSPIPNYYDNLNVPNFSNGFTDSLPIDEPIQGTNSNGQILDYINTRHLSTNSTIHHEHSLCSSDDQFTSPRTTHSHCSDNMIIQDSEESLKCHMNCSLSIPHDFSRNCSSISNCSSNENLDENIVSDISLQNKSKSCKERLTSVFSRLEQSINELSTSIDSLEKKIDT